MEKTFQGKFSTTTKAKLATNVKMGHSRHESSDVDVTIRSKTTKE